MSILNHYDHFSFSIMLLFLYLFLFGFIMIIINNKKNRSLYQQKYKRNSMNSINSINNNNNNDQSKQNCIPSPTRIGDTIQMTTCPT